MNTDKEELGGFRLAGVSEEIIGCAMEGDHITDHELGQMINYLRITGHRVGLILNFKRAKFEWKRVAL